MLLNTPRMDWTCSRTPNWVCSTSAQQANHWDRGDGRKQVFIANHRIRSQASNVQFLNTSPPLPPESQDSGSCSSKLEMSRVWPAHLWASGWSTVRMAFLCLASMFPLEWQRRAPGGLGPRVDWMVVSLIRFWNAGWNWDVNPVSCTGNSGLYDLVSCSCVTPLIWRVHLHRGTAS